MKKRLAFVPVLIFFFGCACFGQTSGVKDSFYVSLDATREADVYSPELVAVSPRFIYKKISWQGYVAKHLNNHIIKRNGAPKRTVCNVNVSYLVTKSGMITDVSISAPMPDYGIIQELTRFFKNCPRWKPAMQNGRNTRYRIRETFEFISE